MFNWFKKLFKKKEVNYLEGYWSWSGKGKEYYLLAKTFGWTVKEISKLGSHDRYVLVEAIENDIKKEMDSQCRKEGR